MALYHFRAKMLSRSTRNTVDALSYRTGCKLIDQRTGEAFSTPNKDVAHVELILPDDAPDWAKELQADIAENRQKGVQKFSDIVESHEKRKDSQVYREIEFALQRELTDEQNIKLTQEFLKDQVASRGMAALANFHFDIDEKTGERKPHCHAVLLTRRLTEEGLSKYKERDWNKHELVEDWRALFADYVNFHLALHGHNERVDHRSYAERGIDIEPQPKRGKAIDEMEKKGIRTKRQKVYDHVTLLSRRTCNTVEAVASRTGCTLMDHKSGETFNCSDKAIAHVKLILPDDAPLWAKELQADIAENRQRGIQKFVNIVEIAEKRKDARVYREVRLALQKKLTDEQNIKLAQKFLKEQATAHGMTALASFQFDECEKTEERKLHCHAMLLTRRLTDEGLSKQKEREWNKKGLFEERQASYEEPSNARRDNHDPREAINHNSTPESSIDLESQPQKNKDSDVKEKKEIRTERQEVYAQVKLRNLVRILKKPELVFEIATKEQSVFKRSDILKILNRYVDDADIFNQLYTRLMGSKELVTLREGSDKKEEFQEVIYTTQTMLKAETTLVKRAEVFASVKSHGVSDKIIENITRRYDELYKESGGLSEDQKEALHYVLESRKLANIVGFAGSGKTTLLKAAKEVWEQEGYHILGLSPLGRLTETLKDCGMRAMTVDRFLKSWKGGRERYKSNTIFVLDEAEMVDSRRFEALSKAVESGGYKLVCLGDNAQTPAVEAGPPFRLVIEVAGSQRLETIIRQKVKWQREATLLFGREQTREALEIYQKHGAFHFVEEDVPRHLRDIDKSDKEGILDHYKRARRIAGNIWHAMEEDIRTLYPDLPLHARLPIQAFKSHQDYGIFKKWQRERNLTALHIFERLDVYRPLMAQKDIDSLAFARSLISAAPKVFEGYTWDNAARLAERLQLPALPEDKRREGIDLRNDTKKALVEAWTTATEKQPDQSHFILSYSNRDVGDLNTAVRSLMKERGVIQGDEITYTVHFRDENDFKDKIIYKEERAFAKGDRLLFLQNDNGLNVKNGTIGTVIALTPNKIKVAVEGYDAKEISFAPRLYPFFDYGWASTIHKALGATVDHTYVLASYEQYQNLTYVALSRHRLSATLFASKLDFWQDEKLLDRLSREQPKKSTLDYVTSEQAQELMLEDSLILWGEKKLQQVKDVWGAYSYAAKCIIREVREKGGMQKKPYLTSMELQQSERRSSIATKTEKTEAVLQPSELPTPKKNKTPNNNLSKEKASKQQSKGKGVTRKKTNFNLNKVIDQAHHLLAGMEALKEGQTLVRVKDEFKALAQCVAKDEALLHQIQDKDPTLAQKFILVLQSKEGQVSTNHQKAAPQSSLSEWAEGYARQHPDLSQEYDKRYRAKSPIHQKTKALNVEETIVKAQDLLVKMGDEKDDAALDRYQKEFKKLAQSLMKDESVMRQIDFIDKGMAEKLQQNIQEKSVTKNLVLEI